MRTLTKTGIRILSAKYRSILIKCAIINASVFMVGLTPAMAVEPSAYTISSATADNYNYYDIVNGVKTYYRITPLSTNTNHYTIAPEGTTDFTIRSNTGTDSYHVTVPGTASSELRGSLSGNVGSGTAQLLYFDQNNTDASVFDAGAITNLNDANNYDIYADFVSNHTATYGGAIRNGGDNSTTAKIKIINGDFVINQSGYNNSRGNGGPGGAIVNGVNSSNATIDIIQGNFIGNQAHKDSGGAIMNQHLIGTITGDFLANSANSSFGGVISNIGDDSVIDSINGNFVSNLVTTVDSNWPGVGGAIYNSGTIDNINGDFILNMADKNAGAIKNARTINNINGDFILNSAMGDGGAIRNSIDEKDNVTVAVATIANITGNFIGNHAEDNGGAIYNTGTIGTATGGIEGRFENNTAAQKGGAIYNAGEIDKITGDFESNSATSDGGAINNNVGGTINNIKGNFSHNSADNGGAIYNIKGTINNIKGNFESNSATKQGGAINITSGIISNITGDFKGNHADSYGGAIYNGGTIANITGDFENNYTASNNGGGAIANTKTINISTSDEKSTILFNGNYITNSTGKGGAIWNNGLSGTAVGLYAKGANDTITFVGGTEDGKYDIDGIYNQATLNINGFKDETDAITEYNGTVNLYNVAGTGTTNIYGGTVNVAGSFAQKNVVVKNATLVLSKKTVEATSETTPLASSVFTLDNSTLNLQNNSTGTVYIGEMRLVGSNNIMLDADLAKAKMDQLKVTSVSGDGNIVISDIKLLAPTTKDKISLDLFADETTKGLLADKVTGNLNGLAYSPIYKYDALYDPTRGQVDFTRYNNGGYDDVNPAIMVGAVAAQVGGYLNQINSYENAFEHMDSYMMLSRNNRLGTSLAVKYITDAPRRAWLKPYAAFETVKLKHGPKVDNNMYGSFAGLDSAIVNLKHGWDIVYSAYASYDGSNQKYDGSSIYQNGGHLGATLSLYKGNFFTGLTANAGASSVKSSTMYGTENMAMFTTGAASKTGYDLELVQDWLIVQPSVLLSYSLVNMSDYTNAAGVKISSDALHAIQIAPELKLISNLPHGWQPYIAGKTVWNMLDETKFSASGIDLPELSTKQYVQYGVGIQKNMFNGFYGYAQAMFRNGGRDGVALNAGLKMAF
ncbi:MAG: hypothetical protein KBT14_04420 [Proteobacteria bacterium]|nr:hypothetical protein [Candidatus Enterousia onthequi]